jgi:hypothetical protein
LLRGRRLLEQLDHLMLGARWALARSVRQQSAVLAILSQMETLLLPRRVCCSWLSAMPVQHVKVSEQAQENISPSKN